MVSIKFKLVFLYITLVFLVMVTCGTTIIVRIKNTKIGEWERDLKETANFLQGQINGQKPEEFEEILKASGEHIKNINDIQIFITSGKGKVITSSTNDNTIVSNAKTVMQAGLTGEDTFNYGDSTKTTEIDGSVKTWIDYAKVIRIQNNEDENRNGENLDINGSSKILYLIYTRVPYQIINYELQVIADTILLASFMAFVLTAVLGLLFASTLTSPILRLTKHSKELAQGTSFHEIPVSSQDEIGQLTSSFNNMAQQLKYTISNIESEKSKLEILLHNMTDGVIAIDVDGKVIHANSLSQEFLLVDDIEACDFIKITNILGLNFSDMNDIDEDTIVKEYTTEIGERYINSIFSAYKDDTGQINGVIIVLQDFTKHKKLDNMRKEFVANVSHEIRTPLTTIKGYTETLLDGAMDEPETATSFLKVIDSEADRMTLLVKDLLELSRFDNQQLKIDLTETDLISVIRETIIQNKLSAERKSQEIIFETDLDEAVIQADRGRIIQVLTNIVSNAIKYSPEKSKIEISIINKNDEFKVDVRDNGIGIPQEDLAHIFERFYRVDKARSRAMGGTGLGLAIAKEIVEAHDGKIFAESQLGYGTIISLIFNKHLVE